MRLSRFATESPMDVMSDSPTVEYDAVDSRNDCLPVAEYAET